MSFDRLSCAVNGSVVSVSATTPSKNGAASDRLALMRAKVALIPDLNVDVAAVARNIARHSCETEDPSRNLEASRAASLESVPTVGSINLVSSPSGLQLDCGHVDASSAISLRAVSHPSVSTDQSAFQTKSAKIHVPMRHARAAVICSSTSNSDSALRSTFWTLLTGEMPSTAHVHSFRCIIEPEISGRKNVWVKALDADPLCYLSLIFSRENVPPITHFSIVNASPQPLFIDSLYLKDMDMFILPFDLDPILGNAAVEGDAVDASAVILNSLVSLFQRISTLCVRHAANGDFIAPSVLLAGVYSKDLDDSAFSILQLVSETIYDMLKGSFLSLGLIECTIDASSCLWFYPVSSSSMYGISAVQDALCAFFYGPTNQTFSVPQHWFHLITTLRQNSQPAVRMSIVETLAAECFALDVPPQEFMPELERFLSFFADQGVAWRSSTERDVYVIDGPLLAWQFAAAALYHDGSIKHACQHLQSKSRRAHQQAYHSFLSTGQLSLALLRTFTSFEALASHTLPILFASGIAVPLSASKSSPSTDVFALLPMMPSISVEHLRPLSGASVTPCLSLICFMTTCDVPSRLQSSSSLTPTSAFALRTSPLYIVPQLWAALRVMVLDELELGCEAIVISSALFACNSLTPFSIEHDVANQVFRLRLHGNLRDMLLSRISCCFSRVATAFPFISLSFALESSQFPSCASIPPALFSLPGLLRCSSVGDTFYHRETKIEAQELASVLGNSNQVAPRIPVCFLYSPASAQFVRAVCDVLSVSRVAHFAVHCFMARRTPFVQPDLEFIDVVNQADHTIVFAEKQELIGALASQPHSPLVSQLSTFHQLLLQSPSHSFSSYIVNPNNDLQYQSQSFNSDVSDNVSSSSTPFPIATSSATSSDFSAIIAKIFRGSEQLTITSDAVDSAQDLPQVQAVSSALLLRLSALVKPRLEEADVFQKEFSPVALASDSALHLSSSIELDVSAHSRMNLSTSATATHHESPPAAHANLHDRSSLSNDYDDGYGTEDEYDSGDPDDDSGVEEHVSDYPPRPPTPPAEDDVLELQSLILSLSTSPSATCHVDESSPRSSSTAPPPREALLHTPATDRAAIYQAKAAPGHGDQEKTGGAKKVAPSAAADEAVEGSSPSPRATRPFLKKGTNSVRQKQRRFEIAKQLKEAEAHSSSPAQSPISPARYQASSMNSPRFAAATPVPASTSREIARSAVPDVSAPRLPYPPNAHPRLLLLLPELCFDRSPSAAQRLVSSWIDDSTRSKSMRLVCLCEMHIARPHGPSSSPLILWHRCSHQGFPVATAKGTLSPPQHWSFLRCRRSLELCSPLFFQFQKLSAPALKRLARCSRCRAWPVSATAYSAACSSRRRCSATWPNGTSPTCAWFKRETAVKRRR